jgi:phosphohistidine phosphatase SixA
MKQTLLPPPDYAGPVALMIRHAERYPIERMINALEVQLTERGLRDSYNLGEKLTRFCPINIYHSPVPRCKQTAESIFEGIQSQDTRATLSGYLLELGGPYITGDWNVIAATIEKQGHNQFIRRWFDDDLPPTLIMSLPKAARIQLKILVNQLTSTHLSSINVTHDWNIMILREYYFKLKHELIGDPDFLDGLYAYMSGSNIILRYHENETIIDTSEIII